MKLLRVATVAALVMFGHQTVQAQENLGVITLSNAGSDPKTCTITVRRGHFYHNLKDMHCNNDEVYYFSLSGLPSAVEIIFCGSGDCVTYSDGDRWRYEIKTLKRDSSVDKFELSKFKGLTVGYVPHKSFKMTYVYDSGQVNGKLSRVQVKYCNATDDCTLQNGE